eukprot:g12403.t1
MDTFDCPPGGRPIQTVPFFTIFLKVFFPCMLWGSGTAIGEIPPYAVARAAREAGKEAETEDEEEFLALTSEERMPWYTFTGMKQWMLSVVERYGFWGVLLFSAWPNMAFDLCGICCGHFGMPFWTFFGGTLVGKAFIKVNMQAVFFITCFTPRYIEVVLQKTLFKVLSESHQKIVSSELEALKQKFATAGAAGGLAKGSSSFSVKDVFNFFMFGLIGFFFVSCINQFAQAQQAQYDKKELEKKR